MIEMIVLFGCIVLAARLGGIGVGSQAVWDLSYLCLSWELNQDRYQ